MAVGPFGSRSTARRTSSRVLKQGPDTAADRAMDRHLGAAFTTGLGRSTSLGIALSGTANVRLGTGGNRAPDDESKGFGTRACTSSSPRPTSDTSCSRNSTARGAWQYLSDGGHSGHRRLRAASPNAASASWSPATTGAIELPVRRANLIRLARIDYRIELEARGISRQRPGEVFGLPDQFTANRTSARSCSSAPVEDGPRRDVATVVILLKPRLIRRQRRRASTQSPTRRFRSGQRTVLRRGAMGELPQVRPHDAARVRRGTSPALWAYLADTYGVGG